MHIYLTMYRPTLKCRALVTMDGRGTRSEINAAISANLIGASAIPIRQSLTTASFATISSSFIQRFLSWTI